MGEFYVLGNPPVGDDKGHAKCRKHNAPTRQRRTFAANWVELTGSTDPVVGAERSVGRGRAAAEYELPVSSRAVHGDSAIWIAVRIASRRDELHWPGSDHLPSFYSFLSGRCDQQTPNRL